MIQTFSADELRPLCDRLAARDSDLKIIIDSFGYPPFWSRPNTFESLVHIILEQQVSLASAQAALEMLRAKVGLITPEAILSLSHTELKAVYFSRQKTLYVRELAKTISLGILNLRELESLPDETVRQKLTAIKGIGNWTADIYLIMVLHRRDIFPLGDLAAVNAFKKLKKLPVFTSKEAIYLQTEEWQPNRTVATMLLWHFYLLSHK